MTLKTWVTEHVDGKNPWKRRAAFGVKLGYEGLLAVIFGFSLFLLTRVMFFATFQNPDIPAWAMYSGFVGLVAAGFSEIWCRLTE